MRYLAIVVLMGSVAVAGEGAKSFVAEPALVGKVRYERACADAASAYAEAIAKARNQYLASLREGLTVAMRRQDAADTQAVLAEINRIEAEIAAEKAGKVARAPEPAWSPVGKWTNGAVQFEFFPNGNAFCSRGHRNSTWKLEGKTFTHFFDGPRVCTFSGDTFTETDSGQVYHRMK